MDEHIFNTIKPRFKYLNNAKLKSLATAIACVALGLRASHLVDVAHLDLESATSLFHALRKHPSLKSLMLLQFKDRYTFLCNKNRLKEHLNSTLNEPNQWIYISVEGKEPVKSIEPPIHLINWLENKLDMKKTVVYSPIVPPFMVALTGWALEYPVIYTTHLITDDPEKELDEWEPRPNCLGSQVLNLVQVWLGDHMLLSFSFPLVSLSQQVSENIQINLENKLNMRVKPDRKKVHLKSQHMKLDRFAL